MHKLVCRTISVGYRTRRIVCRTSMIGSRTSRIGWRISSQERQEPFTKNSAWVNHDTW